MQGDVRIRRELLLASKALLCEPLDVTVAPMPLVEASCYSNRLDNTLLRPYFAPCESLLSFCAQEA
jgi:hypothetical protein